MDRLSMKGEEEHEEDGKGGHARRKRMMLLSKSGGLRKAFERRTLWQSFPSLQLVYRLGEL
jgi:hypothetical protein